MSLSMMRVLLSKTLGIHLRTFPSSQALGSQGLILNKTYKFLGKPLVPI